MAALLFTDLGDFDPVFPAAPGQPVRPVGNVNVLLQLIRQVFRGMAGAVPEAAIRLALRLDGEIAPVTRNDLTFGHNFKNLWSVERATSYVRRAQSAHHVQRRAWFSHRLCSSLSPAEERHHHVKDRLLE